jgi:peptidoglycan hydrolase CwlO-like protein
MTMMTQQIPFDRTRYTDKLRENGVDEKTARAHGEALDGVLREAVVTQSVLKEQISLVDARFVDVDKRFDAADRRFDKVEARIDKLEAKIDAVEIRYDAKLDKLESKVMTAISESKQQLT